jgi:predicted aldo/keto reductase-like oxidoreductase
MMNRRDFISTSIAGAGTVVLGLRSHEAAAAAMFDPFEAVPLGRTGVMVSRTTMGTGMRGGRRASNQTRMGQEAFSALANGAYDRGIRFFDLADLYGTHGFLAEALRERPRDSYAVGTKIWFRSGGIPEEERPAADVLVERFLRELETDYIDVLLFHCAVSGEWPSELQDQKEILSRLKEQGKIRAHGVSCHSLDALRAAAVDPWVDVVFARINAYGTKMDGPPEEVVPVLRQFHAAGKGVVGMKLIGEGEFRDDDEKRNESVRFVLGLGCVDTLTVGFERIEEVDDFAARVRAVPRI